MVQHLVAPGQTGRAEAGRRGWRIAVGVAPGVFGDGLQARGVAGLVAQPKRRQPQRPVGVGHRLREVRIGAGIIQREQAPGLAQLGKLVGQQLVKALQVGLELLGLRLALLRHAVGQAGRADAPGLRKPVQQRVVAGDLPVSADRRGQIALRVDAHALRGGLRHALAKAGLRLGADAGLVNPHAAPVQADGRAGDVEAGAAVGIDAAQPVAADAAVDDEFERLDGQHAGQVHQQMDQVRQAQRIAPRGPVQIGRCDEAAVEQGPFKHLVDARACG